MPAPEMKAPVFQWNSVQPAMTSALTTQAHWLVAVTQVLVQRLPVTEFVLNELESVERWTVQQLVCLPATLPTVEPSALKEPTGLLAVSGL